MITAASLLFSALVTAPPIEGLDKVPEIHRQAVTDYVAKTPVVGKGSVWGIDQSVEDKENGKRTFSIAVLDETAGEGDGCRFRVHRLEHASFTGKDSVTTTEGTVGQVGSDCCALDAGFACDRTGTDWVLHFERARSASDGKTLSQLVFRSFFLKSAWSENGKVHSETLKISAADLAKGKRIAKLPPIDLIHMAIGCDVPDAQGAFSCTASQGGNHVTFRWKSIGDKTGSKFETKLVGIETQED